MILYMHLNELQNKVLHVLPIGHELYLHQNGIKIVR